MRVWSTCVRYGVFEDHRSGFAQAVGPAVAELWRLPPLLASR